MNLATFRQLVPHGQLLFVLTKSTYLARRWEEEGSRSLYYLPDERHGLFVEVHLADEGHGFFAEVGIDEEQECGAALRAPCCWRIMSTMCSYLNTKKGTNTG